MAIIYPWLLPQWSQLMKQQQSLPHALLFSGRSGLGKTALAYALGKTLLCSSPIMKPESKQAMRGQACGKCHSCLLLAAGTHPDFYTLKPVPPKNSKSKHPLLSIHIDSVRELCRKLSQTSQMSGYRIAIIEQADRMNNAAANSLLKTLEEPGGNTLLILLSAMPSRLPITIRSRCQQLKFSSPVYSQVEDWLMSAGEFAHGKDCQQAFRLSHDAPLLALEVANQLPQRQLLASALLAEFNQENSLDYALKLSQCDKQQLLGWLLDWVNDLIYLSTHTVGPVTQTRVINQLYTSQLTQLAERLDKNRLFSLQSQILQTLQHSSIALNPQLLWENLLLSWSSATGR